MANTLEQRRRAIADALRAIMAEPLPPTVSSPAPAQPVDAPLTDEWAQGWADEWAEDELTDRGDVIVPPMEPVASMSRTASLALFGHA